MMQLVHYGGGAFWTKKLETNETRCKKGNCKFYQGGISCEIHGLAFINNCNKYKKKRTSNLLLKYFLETEKKKIEK
jgi:hypothetical protein